MAKRRRRRRKSARVTRETPRKKVKKHRRHLTGMECPNHNMCFDLPKKPGRADSDSKFRIYPMLRLAKGDDGGGSSEGLIFVDDIYGLKQWADRDAEAPPTWMDPEIFIRMVVKDEDVEQICRDYVKKKDDGRRTALLRRINEIYEEKYLVYMLEKFGEIDDIVAQWVVGYFATRVEDEAIARFNAKHKKAKSNRRS